MSEYAEFVAKVTEKILCEAVYEDSEGRTIVVIDMLDLFSQFALKKQGGGE
jgi:hypothetical protein